MVKSTKKEILVKFIQSKMDH